MARFLALDLGAESGRGIIADVSSDQIALREVHRFATHNRDIDGTLQWDFPAIWNEIKTALRNSADDVPLDGIGADTWGVDFGLLDAHGNVLGNPVHYRDARTDGVMDLVLATIGRERLYAMTGIQFLFFNTLFQLVALKAQGLPIAAGRLLFMPDLIHYRLSGEAVIERTIASTSALLDPQTQDWSRLLLAELGLPASWFGKIVPTGTRVGGLLANIAAETGLRAGTPIIAPASHDTASAVAAVPATSSDDWAYISSGTWSLLGTEIDAPVLAPDALRLNFTNELGAGGKVRLLKNIMGLWLVQETRRDLARRGTDLDYAELTRLAAEARGLDLLLSSWYPPLARPGDFLRKIDDYAAATDQPAPRSPGGYVRACLDSLALSYRSVLEELEAITDRRFNTLHIVGGGSKNELLNQMTADATGRTVVAGPVEATAIGNTLTQAIGVGVISSLQEARRLVARSFDVKIYQPQETARYEKVLPHWRELVAESIAN